VTDKELLELAAKAAGIKVPSKKDYPYAYINKTGIHRDISYGGDGTRMSCWNPLINDGDALRLAVKLGIEIGFDPRAVEATAVARACEVDGQTIMPWAWEELEPDPYAATRRAIVRAAAEIGREMK